MQKEYSPSLFPTGFCFECGMYNIDLARHEIFGGYNRQKSKTTGLWVNLCPRCHELVHSNDELMKKYRRIGQRAIMEEKDWTIPDFIREFGKNYLEVNEW